MEQSQELPQFTIGDDAPKQFAVQESSPQFRVVLLQAPASLPQFKSHTPSFEQLITAFEQALLFAQVTSQEYTFGQTIDAFMHDSSPVHTTSHEKSGGQILLAASHSLDKAQSMIHRFPFGQPPVHTPGQEPPGGLGSMPHSISGAISQLSPEYPSVHSQV